MYCFANTYGPLQPQRADALLLEDKYCSWVEDLTVHFVRDEG